MSIFRAPSSGRILLIWGGLIALLAFLAAANPYEKSGLNRSLGGIVVILALAPLLGWLTKRNARDIPLLGMHGLFYAVCFGFAGFVTVPLSLVGEISVSESEYTTALLAALLSWGALVGGYTIGKLIDIRLLSATTSVDSPKSDRLAVTLYPCAVVLFLIASNTGQTDWLQIAAALRVFFFVWVIHAALSGNLPARWTRVVLAVFIPAECLLFGGIAGGTLVGLLIYAQLLGITYSTTRGRTPVVLPLVAVALFAVLTPAKNDYRVETRGDNARQLGVVEGTKLFVSLAWQNAAAGDPRTTAKDTFEAAYARVDHLHTVAAVMADTPGVQPFRYGWTLLPLLTKWIPRVVWADKPREELGNRWARDYRYLGPNDEVTSYNLPWLAEMFMNFGWSGVIVLSLAVGVLMGALWRWLISRRAGSAHFAFSLTLTSAFFFPESNMSLQLGGLVVAGVTMMTALTLLRHFTGEARTRVLAPDRPRAVAQ